jgi:hypothetical protein
MTRDDIDKLWNQALQETVKAHEPFVSCFRFAELVAAAEREACAKVCDEIGGRDGDSHAWDAAAAIRARGET